MQSTGSYRWRRFTKLAMSTRVDALGCLFLFATASVLALSGAATHAQGQPAGKIDRIGFLRQGQPPKAFVEAF
jgi:hypothetical protein